HLCEKGRLATTAKHDPIKALGSGQRKRDGSKRPFGMSRSGPRAIARVKHRGSCWWYGNVGHGHDPSSATGHPATFAERFALDAVLVWSNPADLVCDPYAGSGTVARACRTLGRRFVGAERVPAYHAAAVTRCSDGPLFGPDPDVHSR